MRILIDIGNDEVAALSQLAHSRGVSRAALVREVIAEHLQRAAKQKTSNAFGIWKKAPKDGVAYQRKLRSEWR